MPFEKWLNAADELEAFIVVQRGDIARESSE